MKHRLLGLAIIALAFVLTCACTATTAPQPAPTQLAINKAVAQHLILLHYRLAGHSALADHEWAVCLRGRVSGDTAYIDDIAAAYVSSFHRDGAVFQCPRYDDSIGIWHNHTPRNVDTCYLSQTDSATFANGPWRISLITCNLPPRFVWRAKSP